MDILFFAAVAVFIFFKLREQLGKIDEEQKREAIKSFIKEQAKISQNLETINQESNVTIDSESQTILDNLEPELRNNLKQILNKLNISANNFLIGAKSAFSYILEEFSKSNLENLKPLLSDKIFQQFQSSIKERKDKKHDLNTKIIAIDNCEISDAKLVDNFAYISVKFFSRQINYIIDEKQETIFGSQKEILPTEDKWTFKKDCQSSNPNWIVVTIN